MGDLSQIKVVLIDPSTASALSQVLPILLLTLMVELRRTELHRSGRLGGFASPVLFGIFFVVFGVIETILVLSIDGAFYPFALTDLIAALIIFGLLAMLFVLSLMKSPQHRSGRPANDPDNEEDDAL
jgi:surface polysaccharide O-acyltransferase-like enzyme